MNRNSLVLIALLFIAAGLMLVLLSIPMFISAWHEYQVACPPGNTKVECH